MRLGGPLFGDCADPEKWVAALKQKGYSAAYVPVGPEACDDVVRCYVEAAKKANIVIAEAGAWSNPMSPDDETRRKARSLCEAQLNLADRFGARCCVNIAGSRGPKWDGPYRDDLTEETFGLIVETVRGIIDAVKPTRTFFALETMPWMYPDSPDCYLRLLKAIDRPGFAVHLDPANLLCSPQRFFGNAELIRECFAKLGPHIRSCHAKDIALSEKLTTHLDEVRPGLGGLDYRVFLEEASKLDPDTPIMLEHLSSEQEYDLAAEHVRSVARAASLEIKGQTTK